MASGSHTVPGKLLKPQTATSNVKRLAKKPLASAPPAGSSLQERLSPLLKAGYRVKKITLPPR